MQNQFFRKSMGDFFVTSGGLNHMNILHGGNLMTRADSVMGMFANSFSHTKILTGRIDNLTFYKKSYVGDHIRFRVTLLKTSRMTMTIYAEIEHVSSDWSQIELVGEAVFTYVAVDDDLKPVPLRKQYLVEDPEQKEFIEKVEKKFKI
ncbi:acyl-CoA thioesterase [Lactobacillus crispatus]|nr:hotdog domain-containing protein [Lactobacillus crispatus]MBI1694703.1 acyl-CoA thioesterase [Lactobacillus crispatus]